MLYRTMMNLLRYCRAKKFGDFPYFSDVAIVLTLLSQSSLVWSSSIDIGPIDSPVVRFASLPTNHNLDRLSTAIVQDAQGYMWFATQSGLFKFDGDTVENVSLRHEAPNQLTFALFVDSKGLVWVGTQMGAASYDPKTRSFNHIPLPGSIQPRVFDFVERDGSIYLATSVGVYSVQEGRVLLVKGLGGSVARTLAIDHSSRLWVGTERQGLFFESNGVLEKNPSDIVSVRELMVDSTGLMWIASFNQSVFSLDPDSPDLIPKNMGLGETALRTRAVVEDWQGQIWVGSDTGLHRWSRISQSFDHFLPGVGPGVSLRGGVIYDLFVDNSGTIWISTFTGISRFNTSQNLVRKVSTGALSLGGPVGSFAERVDGVVAIGTNRGILSWDLKRGLISDYWPMEEALRSIVTALTWGQDGSLWIGTYSDGLFRLKGTELFGPYENGHVFERDGITDLHFDQRDRLWIATAGAGLHSLDVASGEFRAFPDQTNVEGGFPGLSCLSISEDSEGFFWISTNDAGPFRFDPMSGNTRDFSEGLEKLASSAFAGKSGLWVGASTGELHFFEGFRRPPKRILRDLSEKVNAVLGLASLGDSLLVIGQGVFLLLSESSANVTVLDKSNGVMAHITAGANAELSTGHVVIGGTGGFNIVSPANLLGKYNYQPKVVLSEIQVGRETLTDSFDAALSLSHQQNDLTFRYFAADFLAPEKQKSAILLKGFDKNWIDNGTNRSVTYTNLNPGSYLLRIRATNSEGVWSPNELALPVYIAPPWWATWWAYSLYFFVILFVFYQLLQMSARRVTIKAEGRFNQRLRHYVSALDDASECVINATESGRILYVNNAIREVLGKNASEAIGHSLFDVLFRSSDQRHEAQAALEANRRYLKEIAYPSELGDRVLEISIRKGEERTEDDVAFVCVVRDVTERSQDSNKLRQRVHLLNLELEKVSSELHEYVKQSVLYRTESESRLDQSERLLRSFHDRISDNFQMLSSIFSIQSARSSDYSLLKALDENQQRVMAVGLVHEQLLQARNPSLVQMGDYVDVLVTSLFRGLAPSNVHLEMIKDIGDVELSIDQAVPVGLIINELVSNALVHGFSDKSHGSGKLRIAFYELAGDCIFLVSDDGRGLSPNYKLESIPGIGFEITSMLTNQLGGDFKLVGGVGTTFEVRFPIAAIS